MESLELLKTRVEPSWIDYNRHLNVAYYHMVFDRATDRFLETIGLGEPAVRSGVGTMFALEDHITYQRELRLGDPLRVTFQLLDRDAKRIHYFLRLYHDERNYLAATCEHLSIYVDLQTRRAAAMPEPVREKLDAIFRAHQALPKPKEAGRVMRLRPA